MFSEKRAGTHKRDKNSRGKSPSRNNGKRNLAATTAINYHDISDSDSDTPQSAKKHHTNSDSPLSGVKKRTASRGGGNRGRGRSQASNTTSRVLRNHMGEKKDLKQQKMGAFLNKMKPKSSGSDTNPSSDDGGFTGTTKKRSPWSIWASSYSEDDTAEYRSGYPGKTDDLKATKNVQFYMNHLQSYPDGGYVEDILTKWFGDYSKLERHHGYIQWLFPIRDCGMNYHAQELQLHEAKTIMDDEDAYLRVRRSYEMMLDFYGLQLNPETAMVSRASHWEERFQHLNRSFHNYLRITRILKSLGELGYEHYKEPFLNQIIDEAYKERWLTNCQESCESYWVNTVKDDIRRETLHKKIEEYKNTKGDAKWREKETKSRVGASTKLGEMSDGQKEKDQAKANDVNSTPGNMLMQTKPGEMSGGQKGEKQAVSPEEDQSKYRDGSTDEKIPPQTAHEEDQAKANDVNSTPGNQIASHAAHESTQPKTTDNQQSPENMLDQTSDGAQVTPTDTDTDTQRKTPEHNKESFTCEEDKERPISKC